MSGGTFEYDQYRIGYIADKIERAIEINGKEREEKPMDDFDPTHYYEYPPEVIAKFKEAVYILRVAQIYAQRIDYLMAWDDGEESFLRRLQEDLNELKKEQDEK
jgi:hypothetical protein